MVRSLRQAAGRNATLPLSTRLSQAGTSHPAFALRPTRPSSKEIQAGPPASEPHVTARHGASVCCTSNQDKRTQRQNKEANLEVAGGGSDYSPSKTQPVLGPYLRSVHKRRLASTVAHTRTPAHTARCLARTRPLAHTRCSALHTRCERHFGWHLQASGLGGYAKEWGTLKVAVSKISRQRKIAVAN